MTQCMMQKEKAAIRWPWLYSLNNIGIILKLLSADLPELNKSLCLKNMLAFNPLSLILVFFKNSDIMKSNTLMHDYARVAGSLVFIL